MPAKAVGGGGGGEARSGGDICAERGTTDIVVDPIGAARASPSARFLGPAPPVRRSPLIAPSADDRYDGSLGDTLKLDLHDLLESGSEVGKYGQIQETYRRPHHSSRGPRGGSGRANRRS